jgi:hypothetical protein
MGGMTHLGPAQPWTTSRPQRSRWWTPAILTQLAVVLVTLGGGVAGAAVLHGRDSGTDVLSVVQAASTSTAAQPTFHATLVFRIKGQGVEVTTTADELIDQVRKTARGTVSAPVLGTLTLVAGNGRAFVQLPGGRTDASGHHWLALRTPQGAAAVGGQDPLAYLKLFADPKDVKKAGSGSIHGVDCTHYRVALDPARLGDLVAKSGYGATVPAGVLDQLKNATMQLWIDDNKLVRRMDMSLEIQQVRMSMRLELSDYGKAVDVTLPAATDVTELASPLEFGQRLAAVAHPTSG